MSAMTASLFAIAGSPASALITWTLGKEADNKCTSVCADSKMNCIGLAWPTSQAILAAVSNTIASDPCKSYQEAHDGIATGQAPYADNDGDCYYYSTGSCSAHKTNADQRLICPCMEVPDGLSQSLGLGQSPETIKALREAAKKLKAQREVCILAGICGLDFGLISSNRVLKKKIEAAAEEAVSTKAGIPMDQLESDTQQGAPGTITKVCVQNVTDEAKPTVVASLSVVAASTADAIAKRLQAVSGIATVSDGNIYACSSPVVTGLQEEREADESMPPNEQAVNRLNSRHIADTLFRMELLTDAHAGLTPVSTAWTSLVTLFAIILSAGIVIGIAFNRQHVYREGGPTEPEE